MFGWAIIFVIPIVIIAICAFLCDGDKFHEWKYRTPYSRTCVKCGRNEDQCRDAFGPDYWDVMCPLPHSPEKCDNRDLEEL